MSIYRRFKTSLKCIFFVSTLDSMGGILFSAIVSERLTMKKSPAIHYLQDTISGVKVNNDAININKP